jgi:outer membrane protein TolC
MTPLWALFFFASTGAFANSEKALTEEVLLERFREKSIGQRVVRAQTAQRSLESNLIQETFQPRLYSSAQYKQSNELPFSPFQPVISPYQEVTVGAEKKVSVGAKLAVETFATQFSIPAVPANDATQMGARLKADFDLWKNFLGQMDRAQLKLSAAKLSRSEQEKNRGQKQKENEIRKVFWSLAASEQSIRLSRELVRSAERQLADAEKRRRAGAADAGEVAKYRSQLESRKTANLLFQYEKERLLEVLDNSLDEFRASTWFLDPKYLDTKRAEIVACVLEISAQDKLNPEYTSADEIVSSLEAETSAEIVIAKKHSDIDVSLFGQAQLIANGNSYSQARSQLGKQGRSAYVVGVNLSIPLGGTKSQSESYLLAAKSNLLEAESIGLSNQIASSHRTMLQSIELLKQGLTSQEENSKNLQLSYQEVERKYRQGRVPVTTLVTEQDSLFQSELSEISLRKQIIHTVLDYLSAFDRFPCKWNKI